MNKVKQRVTFLLAVTAMMAVPTMSSFAYHCNHNGNHRNVSHWVDENGDGICDYENCTVGYDHQNGHGRHHQNK